MNSIALTALIEPSRILRVLLTVFFGALCCSGAWLIWQRATWPLALAGFLLSLTAVFFYRPQQPLQLDISGSGQIRLAGRPFGGAWHLPSNVRSSAVNPAVLAHGELVRIQPHSTLWPVLLLLHLKTESGRTIGVIIMRDSVSEAVFRALIIAIKAIYFKGLDADGNPEKKTKKREN